MSVERQNRLSVGLIRAMRAARKARGWSQVEYARRMTEAGYGMSRAAAANREQREETSVSVDEAAAMAAVLGLSLDSLVALAAGGQCARCSGSPPSGFTCRTCGAPG